MRPATTPPPAPAGGRPWEVTTAWATGALAELRRWFMQGRRRALPHLQGETTMLSLAVAVGVITGLLASPLIGVIALVRGFAFGTSVSWPLLLIVPSAGGLVVGLLVTYLLPESSGGVGSQVGRMFAVGEDRMRTLVAAGAAAGIGASFNGPIGGMLFAIELLIGRFRSSALQSVVVAWVVGSVTAQRKQVQQLRDLSGTQFVEFRVTAEAPAAGRQVRQVSWPSRTVLTSIRRNGEVVMPSDTLLEPEDEVTVLADLEHIDDVQALLAGDAIHPSVSRAEPCM